MNRSFDSNPLEVDGEGNTYFAATTLWSITSGAGKVDTVFKIKDLVIPWYREGAPGQVPSLLAPQLGNWIPTSTATPDMILSSTEGFRRAVLRPNGSRCDRIGRQTRRFLRPRRVARAARLRLMLLKPPGKIRSIA